MQLTLALSLGLIVAGLAAPFVGNLIDRGHGRAVLTGGSLLGAAMYAVWSWSPNLPPFFAAWAGMGVAHSMTLHEPAFAVLHRELGGRANLSDQFLEIEILRLFEKGAGRCRRDP